MFAWSASSNNRASMLWLAKVVLHSQCQGPLPCSEVYIGCLVPSASAALLAHPPSHSTPPSPSTCSCTPPTIRPNPMDNCYFGDRDFHGFQNNYHPDGFNNNRLNIFGQQPQQQHGEQYQHQHQPLSPGQPRSRGSSFTGSPASPASAHPVSVSQPSATQSQPGYFPIGTTGALQPTLSPVTPTYDTSRSHSMHSMPGYSYGTNYGQIDNNGAVRLKNSSD
jgi:hypothetical protein